MPSPSHRRCSRQDKRSKSVGATFSHATRVRGRAARSTRVPMKLALGNLFAEPDRTYSEKEKGSLLPVRHFSVGRSVEFESGS